MAELPSIDDIGPPDLERQFYNLPKSLIESKKIIEYQGKQYVIPETKTKEDFLKGNTDITSLRNFIDLTRANMLRKREDISESDSIGNKAYFGFMDLLNNTTGRLFPNTRKENLEILGRMRQAQYVSPETRDTVAEYFGTSTEDIDKDLDRIEFAKGDLAELPDVGSIQPLTEAEKRAAFGTPLTRALKMDPISLERSPVKRGIASIGSNILDMLPGFSLQKGMQEGDPIQMGLGVTDLLPGAALLKVGSKAVTDLANKLARMTPEDIAAVKQQYNPVFRDIFEQQERIINSAGATNADKAAAREVQRKINANYSIMFDNAGKKYQSQKGIANINKPKKVKGREGLYEYKGYVIESRPKLLNNGNYSATAKEFKIYKKSSDESNYLDNWIDTVPSLKAAKEYLD